MTITRDQATAQAIAILRDEANSLQCELTPIADKLSHRAKVAIQREISRLKLIADALDTKCVDCGRPAKGATRCDACYEEDTRVG